MWPFKTQSKETYAGLPTQYQGNSGWDMLWGAFKSWKDGGSVFDMTGAAQCEATYASHPIVNACVRAIAKSAVEPRLEIGMEVGDEWKSVQNHPLLELIESPHPEYTANDFVQYGVSRLKLSGAAYAIKIRGSSKKKIVQLWPIPSAWVTPVKPRRGDELQGGFKIQGFSEIVPNEDMIVWRMINPATTNTGASSLGACWRDYRLDVEREIYMAEMLANMKMPGMVVSPKEGVTLSEKQVKDLQAVLDERTGRGNRGNVLALLRSADVQIVNPLGDFDWPGITSLVETRICAAFGVPPIVIHSRAGLDRATYSNYKQAREAFYQETMIPTWDLLADGLTLGLLRKEGDFKFKFRYRWDELPFMRVEKNLGVQLSLQEFTSGVISRDEARLEIGYEADPDFVDPTQLAPDPAKPE